MIVITVRPFQKALSESLGLFVCLHIKLDTPKGVVSPLPQIVPETTHQIVPQTVYEIGSKGHYKGTPPKVILLKEEMMSFPASLN